MEKITKEHPLSQSHDVLQANIDTLKSLFPTIVKEGKIDLKELEALISDEVETNEEYYRFTWVGKSDARREANKPSTATLRPDKESSKKWDSTNNLYVEGDNLEVLKLLQKSYSSQIKLIYIDPPYNTGKDFVYRDNYSDNLSNYLAVTGQLDEEGKRTSTNTESDGRYHSNWLKMMYPRLKLARNLLRNDGVLIVSIDEKEVHNLRKLCDEIFGEDNFAGEIIWKNSSKNDQDYISIQHEYILCFVKSKTVNKGSWIEKKEGLDEIYKAFDSLRDKHGDNWEAIHREALEWYSQFPESNPIKSSKHYNWMDEKGVYFASDISGPNHGQYVYDVYHPETGELCKPPASGWRYPENTMKERIKNGLVHFANTHDTVPNNKTYLKDTEFQSLTSIRYKDGRVASKNLTKLFGENLFTNPKDPELLYDLFKSLGVKDNDIVLDFFSGSGTTSETIMKLNTLNAYQCKFILVQLPENLVENLKSATGSSKATLQRAISYLENINKPPNIAELAKERIRLAGDKIISELQVKADEEELKKATELPLGDIESTDFSALKLLTQLDIGFKVFKLDSSNIHTWDGSIENLEQNLFNSTSSIKIDRTEDDVLFEVLLKYGLNLTVPIEEKMVGESKVYSIGLGSLFVCLANDITLQVAEEIGKWKQALNPSTCRVLFNDNGFKDDVAKTNSIQILKQYNIQQINSL